MVLAFKEDMKMRKKKGMLFLAGLLALALIAPVSAQQTNLVELNTLSGPNNLDFLLQRFQQLQTEKGIRVNVNVLPYGRDAV